MLTVKATGDILTVMSLIDCNRINAAAKLIINTEDSLAEYFNSLHKYKVCKHKTKTEKLCVFFS